MSPETDRVRGRIPGYDGPHDDAARTAAETLRDTKSGVREARIVAFSPATLAAVQTLL
jgi:hypothetical protein